MPNAYQKRLASRKALQHERASRLQQERWLEVLSHCNRYEAAYLSVSGRLLNVRYHKGWYLVRDKRYREADLDEMSKQLEAQKHLQLEKEYES